MHNASWIDWLRLLHRTRSLFAQGLRCSYHSYAIYYFYACVTVLGVGGYVACVCVCVPMQVECSSVLELLCSVVVLRGPFEIILRCLSLISNMHIYHILLSFSLFAEETLWYVRSMCSGTMHMLPSPTFSLSLRCLCFHFWFICWDDDCSMEIVCYCDSKNVHYDSFRIVDSVSLNHPSPSWFHSHFSTWLSFAFLSFFYFFVI